MPSSGEQTSIALSVVGVGAIEDVGVKVGGIVAVNVEVNSGLGVGNVGVDKGCNGMQPDMNINNTPPITWFMLIFFKIVNFSSRQ